MPDITKTLAEPCGECGMLCHPAEFHPYAACLMFKGCHDGAKVRANLAAAFTQGAGTEEVERLMQEAKRLVVRCSDRGADTATLLALDRTIDTLAAIAASAIDALAARAATASSVPAFTGDDLKTPRGLLRAVIHEAYRLGFTDAPSSRVDDVVACFMERFGEGIVRDATRWRGAKARHAMSLVRLATGSSSYSSEKAPAILDAWADQAAAEIDAFDPQKWHEEARQRIAKLEREIGQAGGDHAG